VEEPLTAQESFGNEEKHQNQKRKVSHFSVIRREMAFSSSSPQGPQKMEMLLIEREVRKKMYTGEHEDMPGHPQ